MFNARFPKAASQRGLPRRIEIQAVDMTFFYAKHCLSSHYENNAPLSPNLYRIGWGRAFQGKVKAVKSHMKNYHFCVLVKCVYF